MFETSRDHLFLLKKSEHCMLWLLTDMPEYLVAHLSVDIITGTRIYFTVLKTYTEEDWHALENYRLLFGDK